MSQTYRKIAIVGTGFSGIGMGIALKKTGFSDFVILEKGSDLGATPRTTSTRAARATCRRRCTRR